ncbi:MAG: 4-coumarate--CoA ligase family protein [Chloroflexi bacterium]|nr:4-coumarate--CoA ligase family protein [Chloroflexota bacterium]
MAPASSPRPSLAPYPEEPVQEILRRSAERFPDKIALIDGDRTFTYKQMEEMSDRLAAALASGGLAFGDRVGVFAPNSVEFAISFFGILKAGGIPSPVNSSYIERELANQMIDCGATALIVHEAMLEVAENARGLGLDVRQLIEIRPGSREPGSFWGMIESATGRLPEFTINPKVDLAALPYSSGTTGLAKGVELTHYNLTSNVVQMEACQLDEPLASEEDVVLVHLPMFHIYGLQVLMNLYLSVGATLVMMGRFDMGEFLGLLVKYRVTQLYTVPPVGQGLTMVPRLKELDLSALKCVMLAAAPTSTDLQQRLSDAIGAPVIQGYGMTELSPASHVDFTSASLNRPGSVVRLTADTEEMIVDLETGETEVAPGEVGELLVRGPQVMKGYFNNPQATAETLTADAWLHTGDIVRADEEGYVWVLDRKKELIKYKGFQVPPAELEGLLLSHPAIADSAVIGVQDEESGEVPKAFVVIKEGQSPTGEEIMEFIAGQVATFKQIRQVQFVDSIPKNPSGKILRRVLIDQERGTTPD